MGSWDCGCHISDLPIRYGDKVIAIAIALTRKNRKDYLNWSEEGIPVMLPFEGTYDDYGEIEIEMENIDSDIIDCFNKIDFYQKTEDGYEKIENYTFEKFVDDAAFGTVYMKNVTWGETYEEDYYNEIMLAYYHKGAYECVSYYPTDDYMCHAYEVLTQYNYFEKIENDRLKEYRIGVLKHFIGQVFPMGLSCKDFNFVTEKLINLHDEPKTEIYKYLEKVAHLANFIYGMTRCKRTWFGLNTTSQETDVFAQKRLSEWIIKYIEDNNLKTDIKTVNWFYCGEETMNNWLKEKKEIFG